MNRMFYLAIKLAKTYFFNVLKSEIQKEGISPGGKDFE